MGHVLIQEARGLGIGEAVVGDGSRKYPAGVQMVQEEVL